MPRRLALLRVTNTDPRFIGKTGGEIFHEMMLRQGVKHICAYATVLLSLPASD
jgi:acetolactate synthase-1/2/3 large subunit